MFGVSPLPESADDYEDAWFAVMSCCDLLETGDPSTMNVSRLSFISDDPDAFLARRIAAVQWAHSERVRVDLNVPDGAWWRRIEGFHDRNMRRGVGAHMRNAGVSWEVWRDWAREAKPDRPDGIWQKKWDELDREAHGPTESLARLLRWAGLRLV